MVYLLTLRACAGRAELARECNQPGFRWRRKAFHKNSTHLGVCMRDCTAGTTTNFCFVLRNLKQPRFRADLETLNLAKLVRLRAAKGQKPDGGGWPVRSGGGMPLRLTLFGGLRPLSRARALRDALTGVTLASMNIPAGALRGPLPAGSRPPARLESGVARAPRPRRPLSAVAGRT